MSRLAEVFRTAGAAYCAAGGDAVPAAFRSLFLAHRTLCYQAFFQASSAVLSRLGSESTYFPGDTPGFFGVLHTWGRNLSYHPHIHYIVPAGAFDSRTHRWHDCPTAFWDVLPKGFMKIRYFGFLHPSSRIPLKLAVALLEAAKDVYAAVDRARAEAKPAAPFCPCCSGSAQVLFFSPPAAPVHSGFT